MRRLQRPQLWPNTLTYWPFETRKFTESQGNNGCNGLIHPAEYQKASLVTLWQFLNTSAAPLCFSLCFLRFGRHPVLIISVLFMLVFGLSVAFSVNVTMFSTLRFFEGFCLAGLALSLYVLSKYLLSLPPPCLLFIAAFNTVWCLICSLFFIMFALFVMPRWFGSVSGNVEENILQKITTFGFS